MKKLKRYKLTVFKAKDSHYDKEAADFAVAFIENLCHTKGTWAGQPFQLLDWQEQIIRDLFGILKSIFRRVCVNGEGYTFINHSKSASDTFTEHFLIIGLDRSICE